tara:strand:+ start:2121 stop:3335 length:1215 start_codon:yes stop_codon:yes gene_type:complete
MLIIDEIVFNTNDVIAAGETRTLSFSGDEQLEATEGSKLINVQLFDNSSPTKFYDFSTNTFTAGDNETTKNRRTKVDESINIVFPASTSATYTVYAYTTPSSAVEFNTSIASSKNIFKDTVTQTGNTVLTFAPATTTGSSTYKTLPTTTRTASIDAEEETISFSFTIENVDTDGNGFGLVTSTGTSDPYRFNNKSLYFESTDTVNGAISSTDEVVVDDLTDISVGMVIAKVSSGSLSGTPSITAIDVNKKTLTLSSDQTFADGITLTFRAIGVGMIEDVIGAKVEVSNLTVTPTVLTKTVRSAVSSSTTVTLNGTYGVAKGATIRGLDVDNSSANAVQSVSASSSAGSMVVQVNQNLGAGTVLTFEGCNKIVKLTGDIAILKQPNANRTVNINLDDLLTSGVGS